MTAVTDRVAEHKKTTAAPQRTQVLLVQPLVQKDSTITDSGKAVYALNLKHDWIQSQFNTGMINHRLNLTTISRSPRGFAVNLKRD